MSILNISPSIPGVDSCSTEDIRWVTDLGTSNMRLLVVELALAKSLYSIVSLLACACHCIDGTGTHCDKLHALKGALRDNFTSVENPRRLPRPIDNYSRLKGHKEWSLDRLQGVLALRASLKPEQLGLSAQVRVLHVLPVGQHECHLGNWTVGILAGRAK